MMVIARQGVIHCSYPDLLAAVGAVMRRAGLLRGPDDGGGIVEVVGC